jgi:DNA-binding GntR family transcriptional regulator
MMTGAFSNMPSTPVDSAIPRFDRDRYSADGTQAWQRRTSMRIVEYIMELIYAGRLSPGDKIDVSTIADVLEVSRSPVREALLELRRQGVLSGKFHRAAYVGAFDEESIRDSFDCYGLLWSKCTSQMAAKSDDVAVEKLSELIDRMAESNQYAEIERLAYEYRRTISHLAATERLRALLRSFRNFVPISYRGSVPALAISQRNGMTEEWSAIRVGDVEATSSATRRLYARQADIIVSDLRGRGVLQ